MKATAATTFAIVGLMYIFQEHGIEMKKSNAVIENYKKQQNILESNLTTSIEKENAIDLKNIKLLSDFEKANLRHSVEIKNLNLISAKKDDEIKKENEKLNMAKESIKQIELEYQAKEREIASLLEVQKNIENNLTHQIEKTSIVQKEKEKIEQRVEKLLTVDKIKTFDSLLSKQEMLESNLSSSIAQGDSLKEKNIAFQATIDEMLKIAEDATKQAIIEHQNDEDQYQSLLSMYKNLEENLTSEIQKENTLIEEKAHLQLKIDSEIQKKRDLESKLADEIDKEEKLKEELAIEVEKEEALKVDLAKEIENENLLTKKIEKLKFNMSELLFIANESRAKLKNEHKAKIEELESELAKELEKEQRLESNLTAEIEKENLLIEEKSQLEDRLVEEAQKAKDDKESALAESKNKIEELETTLSQEMSAKGNLESNLTAQLEEEKLLIEEVESLKSKIEQQIALSNDEKKKIESEHNSTVQELQEKLVKEIEKEHLLESNLSLEIEKKEILVEEKVKLASKIDELLSTIEMKSQEISKKDGQTVENLTKIEELTLERDNLQKLTKEKDNELIKERDATQTALLAVEKGKNEMQNLLQEIEEKRLIEEKKLIEKKRLAKEKLLEVFQLTKVEFEVNSMKLTRKSEELLNTTAEVIKRYPSFRYNIQGHTDSRGNEEFNVKLSGKRANQVKKYLVSRGIREDILSTEGIGSAQPIADNETEEGRVLNRRVVFEIIR
jgi:outer membrane protein OmpA-like peptidoglycan-associated protein